MDVKAIDNRIYEIDFKAELTQKAARTDQILHELLNRQIGIPTRLKEAMEYMLLSPGKRIRATLTQWVCQLIYGQVNQNADIAAAAVEMIHTYSLIHDDLPAIDDDNLRRGQPSCHKQYNEATAILTGDALLTLAFEVLATEIETSEMATEMIRVLAEAAGPTGMIAGQIADLEGEQTVGTLEHLQSIHINKTGRLFAAASGLGAIAAGATDAQFEMLLGYGLRIGLGFQIADDLLDVSASSEQLGKTAGKDKQQGKLTYPGLVGIHRARDIAENLATEAIDQLTAFGPEADILRRLVIELLERKK